MFGYEGTVKKYLDLNIVDNPPPDYVMRGWKNEFTDEEKQFQKRTCLLGPDIMIPNSIVRQRLGTNNFLQKENKEILAKTFDLPDELLMDLLQEVKVKTIEDLKGYLDYEDDDEIEAVKRKSTINTLISKRKERQKKTDMLVEGYYSEDALSLEEIIEEIRANTGRSLNETDIKLIVDLMNIIQNSEKNDVLNVHSELIQMNLIQRYGGIPKVVQALEEIQGALEQVAMRTNIASLETVLTVLAKNNRTYRLAEELLNTFNEKTNKTKRESKISFDEKFGEINEQEQQIFNIFMRNKIERLYERDLSEITRDFIGLSQIINPLDEHSIPTRDNYLEFLTEHINIIFKKYHLDGVKKLFESMKSDIGKKLLTYLDKIEQSLKVKLTDNDLICMEQQIFLAMQQMDENEANIFYEKLCQQDILKRQSHTVNVVQTVTIGLTKKIATDGLQAIIESINSTNVDSEHVSNLTNMFENVDMYLQRQSTLPMFTTLEQIYSQLGISYFIETQNMKDDDIKELAKGAELYNIMKTILNDDATKEQMNEYLDNFKAFFLNEAFKNVIQQTLVDDIDLTTVKGTFYNDHVRQLLNNIMRGTDYFNRKLVLRKTKHQLKRNKELPDKLFRQFIRNKYIRQDPKSKIDTNKKKTNAILSALQVLITENKTITEELVNLLSKAEVLLPDRVRKWYIKPLLQAKVAPSSKGKQKTTPRRPSSSKRVNVKKILSSKPLSTAAITLAPTQTAIKPSRISSKKLIVVLPTEEQSISPTKFKEIVTSDGQKVSEIQDQLIKTTIETSQLPKYESEKITEQAIDEKIIDVKQYEEEFLKQRDVLKKGHVITRLPSSIIVKEEMLLTGAIDVKPQYAQLGQVQNGRTFDFSMQSYSAVTSIKIPEVSLPKDVKELTLSSIIEYKEGIDFEHKRIHRKLRTIDGFGVKQQRDYFPTELNTQQPVSAASSVIGPIIGVKQISSSPKAPITVLTASRNSTRKSTDEHEAVFTKSNGRAPSPKKQLKQKSLRSDTKMDDVFNNSFVIALKQMFNTNEYKAKLQKLHNHLVSGGFISPLNEFYRSIDDAIRVTLEHCGDYDELIKWTLSILQATDRQKDLLDFGFNLYAIAVDLDLQYTKSINNVERYAREIEERIKQELQTISENELR
ncbi:unnamed protein product, partial [Didymodactylos carnosus]